MSSIFFKQSGVVDDPDAVDAPAKAGNPKSKKSATLIHKNEFPVDNAVVDFP